MNRFRKFEYKEFNIVLDNIGNGISISFKELSQREINGVKFWQKDLSLIDFIREIKKTIKYMRESRKH